VARKKAANINHSVQKRGEYHLQRHLPPSRRQGKLLQQDIFLPQPTPLPDRFITLNKLSRGTGPQLIRRKIKVVFPAQAAALPSIGAGFVEPGGGPGRTGGDIFRFKFSAATPRSTVNRWTFHGQSYPIARLGLVGATPDNFPGVHAGPRPKKCGPDQMVCRLCPKAEFFGPQVSSLALATKISNGLSSCQQQQPPFSQLRCSSACDSVYSRKPT